MRLQNATEASSWTPRRSPSPFLWTGPGEWPGKRSLTVNKNYYVSPRFPRGQGHYSMARPMSRQPSAYSLGRPCELSCRWLFDSEQERESYNALPSEILGQSKCTKKPVPTPEPMFNNSSFHPHSKRDNVPKSALNAGFQKKSKIVENFTCNFLVTTLRWICPAD